MKKTIIKMTSFQLTRGYGHFIDLSESEIWDKILEFSKNKNIRYLKHIIREEWKENKKYPSTNVNKIKIPNGDNTIYLDIYYEKRKSN